MCETSWSRLIIFITCLMKAAEVQAQCVRPNVGENMVMINDLNQQTFLNGSTVTFQCSTGYRPVDSSVPRTITCVGTEWTNLELNCTKKTCGAFPDLPNGKYTYPDGILFGATAIAQCNEGYLLVGEKNRNCRDNGWDGRDPVCEVVKCSAPSSIQNGQFDPVEDSYDYNQAVTYSCTGSYTLIGESVLTCSNNGTFHPSPPKCLLVECETPNIKNAVRVEGKSPPYGYKNFVRYECNEGYIMSGTGHLVCEENGWNPPPPECLSQCVRPNVGENMVMNNVSGQQTFLNGSTVTFQCSTGYRPVDSSVPRTITCVGTEWTNLELICTKKTCGALPDLPNGKYTYPDGILFGATAIAQCNEGYLLVGEKNRNCRDNGWDGRDPVCEVVKCSAPSSIQNGQFDPVEDSYDYNQAVTYSCIGSYTLIGESVLTCSNNGTFHPSPPKCLLVECETPNIKNAVRVEGKSPPYGYKNFVRYECNEGYIMSGTSHLVCEENGWNPPPPECLSQCVRPNVGENMVMNNDSGQQTFLNGSTVTFQCSTGYRPVDSSVPRTITCVGTEWTHLELNCTKKTCGALPDFSNGKYTYPDGILFGATAIAQCNEGYMLVGGKNRYCRDNGWDGRDPVCEVDRIQGPITTSPPSDGNCVKPSIITIAAVVSIVVLLGPKNYHLD